MSQTLLLADDSVTIQRVIELTFADEDIRVIAVGDGQQAIDRITADPPDIVLADTGMPDRDGYDVARFIMADPALAHIPVVLLTGAFEPVDEDRAREVGCDAVLVKPFEPQAVINRVRELLGSRSAAAEATSGPVDVVPSQAADADAPTLHAETAERPVHDPDESIALPGRHASSGDTEPPPPSVSNDVATASDDPRPAAHDTPASEEDSDWLEGALRVLEGVPDKLDLEILDATADDAPALHDVPPSTPDAASPPPDRSVQAPVPVAEAPPADGAPATPAPQVPPLPEPVVAGASGPPPSFEVVIEPTSLNETPRPVAAAGPPSESISAPPSPEPLAPAPPPEPLVVSAPDAAPPSPQRAPEAGVPSVGLAPPAPPAAPVDTPPSLADAFTSLLEAEQGDADRAQTVYPWPRPPSSAGVNEELIDRVAERVITRLSDGAASELVAQVVARVAEKLVREEIDRLKRA